MALHFPVDGLVANLLALAEVAADLPPERLEHLAAFAADLSCLLTELDTLSSRLVLPGEGALTELPNSTWDRLIEICDNNLALTSGRIAVELFDIPGFRAAVQAWRPIHPEQVRLEDKSLAQRTSGTEPRPAGGIEGLWVEWGADFGRLRRLVALSKAALEQPVAFAGWTDQLEWLAVWLGANWPRKEA